MIDIISREVSSTDLKDVVNKLIPDSIARDIEKACQGERTSIAAIWEKWWQFRHIEENTWSFWFARQADTCIRAINKITWNWNAGLKSHFQASTLCTMCTSGRWRWWRGPASTSTSLWTCTARAVVSWIKLKHLKEKNWNKCMKNNLSALNLFRQNCCDHRRCHWRGCGETRGIWAPSAGVCLDIVSDGS